jgi:mono/diheme cytochrome c family protein
MIELGGREMVRCSLAAVAAAALVGMAGPGFGQQGGGESAGAEIGRIEFMAGCAQCHGTSGEGDGIIADYLTVPPSDLTTIQRDNDGVFPAGVLYEMIEGASAVGAHGVREMPAWGDRYSVEAHLALGWPLDPEDRDAFIRSRILALVEYVASIQRE